jgi:hypothetical protein
MCNVATCGVVLGCIIPRDSPNSSLFIKVIFVSIDKCCSMLCTLHSLFPYVILLLILIHT